MKRWMSIFLSFLLFFTMAFTTVHASSDKVRHKVLKNLIKNNHFKSRVLWYDLSANIHHLNTPEKVRDIVKKTAKANIQMIVLDIKNYTGFVGYHSKIAPHMSTSKIKNYDQFPKDYDLLATVLQEAHKEGIKVHVNVNVFSEGNNDYQDGPAFAHPEWQSSLYTVNRIARAENGSTYPITGLNQTRGSNQMILYTPDKYEQSPANQWGVEVQIINGKITKIVDRVDGKGPVEIPKNGVLLSAHGKARTWVLENLEVGQELDYRDAETAIIPSSAYPAYSTFVNPIREDVINYELSIIEEIIKNYNVDGIVLDRARYSNEFADFSELSREKFEAYIDQQVENWPEDIFKIKLTDSGQEIERGPLYKKWIEFRAKNIQSFFKKAEKLVHDYNPTLFFSTYVGAWYPLYYNEGVNWASRKYIPDYDWASNDYHKTGYAEYLDFLMTGNYFHEVTRKEAIEAGNPDWFSVEGSADIAMEVVKEATFVYGSLYLQQYKGDPEQFRRALRMATSKTHGIMLFDLVYIEEYNWWSILEEEFSKKSKPPHEHPPFLKMIRDDQ